MRGVILAGGHGTRLNPLTEVANKHLLPVYDTVMIEYPLQTLKNMGCDSIVIVSGGEHIGGFAEYLGDGSRFGVDIIYKVQREAGGIAQALKCVEGLTEGVFPVILGDNFFAVSPEMPDRPTIFVKKVNDTHRFGALIDGRIVEKPKNVTNGKIVVGLYVYDDRVFKMIDNLSPSNRGELEITDINNLYLDAGIDIKEVTEFWSDMGTFDSLYKTATFIRDEL